MILISQANWNSMLARLTSIEARLSAIQQKETAMAKTLDDLVADVTATKTVNDSVVTLLSGLSAQIADLKTRLTDPATAAKIDALAQEVEAQNSALAAAVTANTPAV